MAASSGAMRGGLFLTILVIPLRQTQKPQLRVVTIFNLVTNLPGPDPIT